ncbi:MAG: methionine--tRNA ligase [Bacillota bacterium]|jgi:methionyl-tRNA synthetase|nr:methionine--tRNA ligase [Bacillota bacterium]
MKEKFYITTPIYYPSGKWHLGTCYTTVVCDALARFKRMQGYDVFYLTGTDEHGQKIEKVAQSHGMPTKKFVDKQVESLKKIWKLLNISYDKFIRTTDEYHQKAVQKIFQKLYDKGDIYKSEYEGWYCTPCEAFWTEKQLKENKCPDCGREVELTKESSYFFRLSKYQDRLIELIENNPEFLQPKSRQNEMLNNFLRAGLQDLAVSRTSFKWGVPVPFDKDHVIYVWIDALSNYITALGYMGEDDSLFKKFWPADIHMMGKEIIRFHSIIWPAILMALDVELPKKVYGHGWLLFGSDKISKSKGNIIDPIILSERYKVDAVRYYLLREIPFGQDGAFSNYAFLSRINADLCNSLGNLLSRTTAMVNQYFDGILPKSKKKGEHDSELIEIADNVFEKVKDNVDKLLIPEALTEIWNLINRSNKYIDETQPWILGKDEAQKDRLSTILYNLVECLRISATLLKPFLPDTAQRILSDLSLQDVNEFSENTKFGYLKGGEKITKSQPLFPRININKELEEMDKLASMLEKKNELGKGTNEIKKPEIEFDDFSKLDLKVGTVKACERIPKSAKLLKLTVEIGDEERTIVSGIAKSFEPDDLVGKQVVVVTNLKPVKLCGVESQGMVLCTEDENGIVLISPQRDVPSGSVVN